MNFNKIFWKNGTYENMTKNPKTLHSLQRVYFLKYILSVKVWIFLNEISILIFAESAIFHSMKSCQKNH